MKNAFKICFLTLLALFVYVGMSTAQTSRKSIEKRKQNALREIAETNKLLKEVRKDKKKTYNQFLIYNRRVELRNNVISEINQEIKFLNAEIGAKLIELDKLRKQVQKIKKEYANLLYHTYLMNKYQSNLMFLLSADNFNQAYKRLKYINQLNTYRSKQLKQLVDLNEHIELEIEQLNEARSDKLLLVEQNELAKHQLNNELREKKSAYQDIKKREKEILAELRKKQEIANKLEKELERLIAKEAKKSAKEYFKLTPEEQQLSNKFSGNKGKLPWPTRRGVVTSKFGKHKHPGLRNVYVNNNGIDITTVRGSKVRCLFNGVVSKVFAIKGANYTVLIRHGDYFTVYQNLINVTVTKDQEISTKDIIGEVYYNQEENSSELHLEIWKGLNRLNPEQWIVKSK